MKKLLAFFVAISGMISAQAIGFTDLTGLRWELPPDYEKRRTSAEAEVACRSFLINGRPSRVPTSRDITNARASRNNEDLYRSLVELRNAVAKYTAMMFAATNSAGAHWSMGLENSWYDVPMDLNSLSGVICVGDSSKLATTQSSPAKVSSTQSSARPVEDVGQSARGAPPLAPKDALATANYDRLKLERSEPNSLAARRAGVEYRDRLLTSIQSGAMPDLKVTQNDVSDALTEWQRAKREFPTSDHTKRLKKDYDYLVKIKGDQDKAARIRGPVLTRVGPEKPSAEAIAARKKADASGPSKPAAQSQSSQPGSSSAGSAPREILCFVGTVPPPGYRCSANKKRSDAPANSISR